jgi:hypothetical protein
VLDDDLVVFAAVLALRGGAGGLVVGGIFLALALVIQRRPRLVADQTGVTVANLTRTTRIPWEDVQGLRVAWYGVSKCLEIERRGRRIVRSWVVTNDPRTGYSSTRLRHMLDDLAVRQEASPGGVPIPPIADDFGFVPAVLHFTD